MNRRTPEEAPEEDLSPMAYDWISAMDPAHPQTCRAQQFDAHATVRCDRAVGHDGRHATHRPFSQVVTRAWSDNECLVRADGVATFEQARRRPPFDRIDYGNVERLAARIGLPDVDRLQPWQLAALTGEVECWLGVAGDERVSGLARPEKP